MRDGISSAGVFRSDAKRGAEPAGVRPELRIVRTARGWNPENFAREQIRGLVRQVFFSNLLRPVRQVVFSPVEPETDMQNLCRRVGHALALESAGTVAVVGGHPLMLKDEVLRDEALRDETELRPTAGEEVCDPGMPLRQRAVPVRGNLWLVPGLADDGDGVPDARWHAHLCEVRREFEYSIVEGPPAGESNEATAMAQLADGIILVLSAHHTRRAAALNIKERLQAAQARLLGAVLSDRTFPIPESLYRRL
ncbi:MAG TPA: hypothetical protein VJ999_05310 [Candidatus Sulfotelmatobacter sp.]|nr:hypothetical protein [Candidatus Sulfotelmatobacter sp.]